MPVVSAVSYSVMLRYRQPHRADIYRDSAMGFVQKSMNHLYLSILHCIAYTRINGRYNKILLSAIARLCECHQKFALVYSVSNWKFSWELPQNILPLDFLYTNYRSCCVVLREVLVELEVYMKRISFLLTIFWCVWSVWSQIVSTLDGPVFHILK